MRRGLVAGRKLRAAAMLAAAAAGVAASVFVARADLILAQPQQADVGPGRPAPGDPLDGVYVRDSAIATDKYNLGQRMQKLQEWHKAAEIYQEILEKYPDRVVAEISDAQRVYRYRSVTVAVQEALARWSAEGLAVYRARYEGPATSLLEQAKRNDYAALHRVLNEYFVTDAAKQAAIRLMDLYIESGDFAAATWIGDRLLQWHPNLVVERPQVLFRTAIAYHMLGDRNTADKRLAELRKNHANDIGTVGGQDVKLAEALEKALASAPTTAVAAAADSWPMYGGGPDRNAMSTAAATPGARIYDIDLPAPNYNAPEPNLKRQFQASYEEARSRGQMNDVMPVLDRGELFFQDGQRIFALHVESGVPLAGWQETYPQRNGQYSLSAASTSGAINLTPDPWGGNLTIAHCLATRQHSITVTDDAVLAVLGQPEFRINMAAWQPNPPAATPGTGGTRLVCLDRATGRQRWIADPSSIPSNPGAAKSLSFSGSPLVVGDNVYVIDRGSSVAGVEDCYVVCYDLNKGTCRWSCYVASSQTAAVNMGGMPTVQNSESLSHLAFASGRIYICTNLGATAAIDAYSGATVWLCIYPRDRDNPAVRNARMNAWAFQGGMPPRNGDQPKPWEFNPVIVSEGKVFTMPTDGKFIHVHDAGTGEQLKIIPRKVECFGKELKLTMLLGVRGDTLVMAANDAILMLEWDKQVLKHPDKNVIDPDAVAYFTGTDAVRGRPFLTASRLYVPAESAMQVIDLVTRKTMTRYPKGGAGWPADEGAGNVVVNQDHVVIATARNVGVYSDLAGVRHKYELAIKTNPANVEARLIYAELMFNAREWEESRRMMDEAVEVLGGARAMRPGPQRDRVFSDCIMFAQKLAAEKHSSEKADWAAALADHLFDNAQAAALTPSQQVNYRLSRARFIEKAKDLGRQPDYERAVQLYQEVLSTPELRPVMLAGDENSGPMPAGKAAELAIAKVVGLGSQHYAKVAAKAADDLRALGSAATPDQLLALAETYPNALTTATSAMLSAADIYEKSGQPRMATQVLRRLFWKYSAQFNGEQKARLVEAAARNYLRFGNAGAALSFVQRISGSSPAGRLTSPLIGPDGNPLKTAGGKTVETYGEAAEALRRLGQLAMAEYVPDARLTLRPGKALPPPPFEPQGEVIDGVQAIVEAPWDRPWAARTDRLVACSAGKLICLEPGATRPMWSSSALSANAAGLSWMGDRLLVWGEGELALLDGKTGQAIWRSSMKDLPAVEMIPGGAVGDGPTAAAKPAPPQDDQVIIRGALRQRIIVNGGVVQPVAPVNPQPDVAVVAPGDDRERILHVCPLIDRVIATTTAGRILAIDLAKGAPVWQTRLANSRGIQQTIATDDFVVLRAAEGPRGQLLVLDGFNGQQVLRKTYFVNLPSAIINCALSPDGTLVWSTPLNLNAQDLYETGDKVLWTKPDGTNNAGVQPYAGMVLPDQLIIAGQQVFAACQGGRSVERPSLRTGEAKGLPLGISCRDANVHMRLVGARLYVFSSSSLCSLLLEHNQVSQAEIDPEASNITGEIMFTRDYTVLPATLANQPDRCILQCFSRELIQSMEQHMIESVRHVHDPGVAEPAKIKAWSAVDGGVYYLAGDDKLHFLKGARKQ